jgi:molybdate transport system permease protein
MRTGDRARRLAAVVAGGLLAAFFLVTLGSLLVSVPWRTLPATLASPLVTDALRVSLTTSLLSMSVVLLLGTPLAWTIARSRFRLGGWLETALQLPEAVPPAVAGLALLLAFGRQGVVGQFLAPLGLSPAFTPAAVVCAQIFVGAPFYVQAATAAFRRLDDELLGVARSLGAGPVAVFVRVALPLTAPGLLGGLALGWARALGEFGATLMFAGNLGGTTQSLPLAVYTALESDVKAAQVVALLLLVLALSLLVAVRLAARLLPPGRNVVPS